MKRLSSRLTFFQKRVFPAIWFGFLIFFVASATRGAFSRAGIMFVLIPLVMAVMGYIMMRKFVWPLADEVHDGGDYLTVRKGGDEVRIPLSEIMNVSVSPYSNPPTITLRLASPSRLGTEISFLPASRFRLLPFGKVPFADDLIVRVDRARSRRAV